MTERPDYRDVESSAYYVRMREIIADELIVDIEKVLPERYFKDPPISAASLEFVELLMELEDRYDIEIPEGDVDYTVSVGDLMRYVMAKID